VRRLVALALLAVMLGAAPATATDPAAPCKTVRYRRHVVAVLGTSEELVGSAQVAFQFLRQGHVRKARIELKAINDYAPTYYQREGAVVRLSVACGL